MRKLVLAMLVSAAALGATPALADGGTPYQGPQTFDQDRDGRNDRFEDRAYDRRFDKDRDGRFDQLEDRAYDKRFGGPQFQDLGPHGHRYTPRLYSDWYPGWRNEWWDQRHVLPPSRLIRRVERQGFYNVRLRGFSHRGNVRAFALNRWGAPVQLRIDPYTGSIVRVFRV